MPDPSPLGLAAENYARSGWYVFPCRPRDKVPMTAHGVKEATVNLDTVRRWWAREPQANIGLNCGKSGLVVVDLDCKEDHDGLTAWAEIMARESLAPHTSTSITGSGGRHLLFRAPDGVKLANSAGRLAPGIDTRSENGYIILPPSIHPNGRAYAWADDTATIEVLPEAVLRLLTTEPDPWQIYTLKDARQPRPPLRWLVDKVVPENSLNVWYGAPGALKSLLLADMAICVAAGRKWLDDGKGGHGIEVAAGPVMWLDFDNGTRRTHERFDALSTGHKVSASAPLCYVSMPAPILDAGDSDSMSKLAARLVDRDIRLTIVDNLGKISGDADENSADMQRPMDGLRWLVEATGVALVIIHHQRKSNAIGGRAGESLRGHSCIEAALDLGVLIARDEMNVTVEATKDRGLPVTPFGAVFSYENTLSHELATCRFFYAEPKTEEQEQTFKRAELEENLIETIGRYPDGMSANQAFDQVGGNRAQVLDVLRQMAKDGRLGQRQGTRGYILYVPQRSTSP